MHPPTRKLKRVLRVVDSDEDDDNDEEVLSDHEDDDNDEEEDDSDYSQRMSRNSKYKKQSRRSNINFSQNGSQSMHSQTQEQLSDNEMERLTFRCAHYFLIANCKKVPIKRNDVGKIIPREYSRRFIAIIKGASDVLQKVFGYKIIELDKKGQFILENTFDLSSIFGDSIPFAVQSHESAILILRTQILSVILMSGGVVSEATLNEFVKNFGADADSKEIHPVFGNVQKLIYQDMDRQGYLEIILHKDCDEPYKEIKWGARARLEVNKKEVIRSVCRMYGESVKPEMWIEQWRDANSDEAIPMDED